GIDPTVRFIGSHISVFKPYLTEGNVPSPGLFMRQDCLRTRNADSLLDDEYFPAYGSYFTSIGAIAPPERISEVCGEAFNFFEKKLKILNENILVRASSADSDLLGICKEQFKGALEIDSKKPEYYRHKIGVEGIRGRNFNIALRNPDGQGFSDVGNIILLENCEKQLGVETAFGTTTILKQLYGLDHVQDCTPVIDLASVEDESLRRKFEDSIIASVVLYREGLRPFGQNNRNRILKQYVRSLSYFRARTKIDFERLLQIISNFEKKEFPDSEEPSAEIIVEFVKAYENELFSKKRLTNDEKKIKESLELLK
ncbi:MAG: hypothetical protein AAB467_03925, partial [Patescibacteria group bacterium]